MSVTVSYKTEFELAYVQDRELQAHRYKVEVTVDSLAGVRSDGEVIDYKILADHLKSILPRDGIMVNSNPTDPERAIASAFIQYGVRVYQLDNERISVENLCQYISTALQSQLNRFENGIRVIQVNLRETADAYATWRRSGEVAPQIVQGSQNNSNINSEGDNQNGVQENE